MAVQIANPEVVRKIERLASVTGLSKTAAVEMAVDRILREKGRPDLEAQIIALLKQVDAIPDRPDWVDPLEWDEHGLPR
ncbi:antitoxin VapB [Stella humosa]|uniref:Antitoxin VapB n=1 Tax=Stella humosa TaxID=94 RepID=A0A3N1M373_9PROT|nr:type II toxin-antitoxin system VapB family antitoxin [Stella humosa]ROQ02024.1 antitoxin VapB [Stella humosa]BBK32414.1 hypothetical protein STHU_30480 [Stella humosa]